jgi:hypothetical protein
VVEHPQQQVGRQLVQPRRHGPARGWASCGARLVWQRTSL